ncbi:two-component sensor histidine kinase [Sphingomonas sp. DBB INV C78]|uniref:sensor histidine kinase n=1 Tax=Sphingomonas sp. DBB INV C78 TaxID=3349434 RepID=UPI0036D3B1C3
MRLIRAAKEVVKRHWPALHLRAILFGTLLFVAALPGVGAVFLRVYENTLVRQTEAELIAQSAVLAAAYKSAWRNGTHDVEARPIAPERPIVDLRTMRVLPPQPDAVPAAPSDMKARRAAFAIAPIIADARAVTLAAVRLLDFHGVVVFGREDIRRSYAALPEVELAAKAHEAVTVLRERGGYQPRYMLEVFSRASALRVHHVRPVLVNGEIVGFVMLSRSPRGLFLGMYQDRGKIALGVVLIFAMLLILAGLLSRGIVRPIETLSRSTQDVGRGSVTVPDPPTTAAIEIRELYENFAVMAERVEQRSRYLRDFAAAMSHEFKTPISGIRGVMELLEDHGDAMVVEDRRRFIANAAADADRMTRLLDRLLDLARADLATDDAAHHTDVASVVRKVAALFQSPSLSVRLNLPSMLPPTNVPADAIETVLSILFENSRQAGASQIDVSARMLADTARLSVIDNGSGVAEVDRHRIFEPFFTAKRDKGGTGLGLPIARSLLEAHGAVIKVSDSKSGAAFEIILSPSSIDPARG